MIFDGLSMVLFIIFFILGFVTGRVFFLQGIANPNIKQNKLFNKNIPKIQIDESKFVTDVDTKSFTKDFKKLGNNVESKENIQNSISKLEQLKKGKKK